MAFVSIAQRTVLDQDSWPLWNANASPLKADPKFATGRRRHAGAALKDEPVTALGTT